MAEAVDTTTLMEAEKAVTSADYYFDSYSHFGIHEEMLKDEVRTKSYRDAIIKNAHLFKGKVVLDVGCGTGILSMFAAQAGAKLVIGVDMSSIIHQAKKIVEANGFSDVITLIQGKMEEVVLPVDKVDIIISEWMGYFLLYESMLDTVLYARDRYLVEGGIIMPDKATMRICAIEDEEYKEEKIEFWNNVYGFDMTCIRDLAVIEPLVDCVNERSVCTTEPNFFVIDILTVTKEELDFDKTFTLQAVRDDFAHAFVVYFDIFFSKCHKMVQFSTGPHSKYTHWKQTVFYLKDVLTLKKGEEITGTIKCARNEKNPRDLNIDIEYAMQGNMCAVESKLEFRLR